MADSGLETGSIGSLQETASEISSINFDDTASDSAISKGCDQVKIRTDQDDSGSAIKAINNCQTKDQLDEYSPTSLQNHSNGCAKDEGERFKIKPKIYPHGGRTNVQWQRNNLHDSSASSSCSSYFFIDASSLNDEEDEANAATAAANDPTHTQDDEYLTFDYPNNEKTMNPPSEQRLVAINKESLVVEIKEADSGDSGDQHSPCCCLPDNNSATKPDEDGVIEVEATKEKENLPEQQADKPTRPVLERRNTFELDTNDESLSSLRQEYERRQGKLVFQHSITHYSGLYFSSSGDGTQSDCASLPQREMSHKFASLPVDINEQMLIRESPNNKGNADPRLVDLEGKPTTLSRGDKLRSSASAHSTTAWVVDMSDCATDSRRGVGGAQEEGGANSSSCSSSSSSNSIRREKRQSGSRTRQADTIRTSSSSGNFPVARSMAWCVDREKENNYDDEEEDDSSSSSRAQPSSLGYFLDLKGAKSSVEPRAKPRHRRRPSDASSERSYCEFFVDLAKIPRSSVEATQPSGTHSGSVESSLSVSEAKKNIFSMFIDLNEPTEPASRSSSSSVSGRAPRVRPELRQSQSESSREQANATDKKPKSSVFMFIESDSPVVRRRTLSSSRPAFKRHSWNTDKSQESASTPTQPQQQQTPQPQPQPQQTSSHKSAAPPSRHKRAHSLSIDSTSRFVGSNSNNGNGSVNSRSLVDEAADKLELHKLRQTQLLQQQEQQQQSDVDTPPNSHMEIVNHEELLLSLKSRNYQELDFIPELASADDKTDKRGKSEGENKNDSESAVVEQRQSATAEGSTTLDTNHQQDECCSELSCTETRKSETFDVSSSSASGPSSADSDHDSIDKQKSQMPAKNIFKKVDVKSNLSRSADNKIASAKSDASTRSIPAASFVRLSDLDKRPPNFHSNSNSYGSHRLNNSESNYNNNNSTRNITGAWNEDRPTVSSTSARASESLYKTLAKKFPLNLNVTLGKSDNFDDFVLDAEAEAVISESDLSSLQSSMGRSGHGSTEETETLSSFAMGSKPYNNNRLGEDLLRMFLEEINPDVMIDVGGRRIRAHKCILSSRCQYFAAILSGGWIESSGNVISLQGYSYNAVHFALRHIYSGESCIPDTISIVELATLADMLCLEGLKEVIGLTLKIKYCHLFHKPCNGCAVGVLECMPLAAAYGLDEVYRKSLRWVTRHFVRIWPSKEFATLPRELMDKCYLQHIVHMSVDNVLQTIMDSDKLLTTLPNVRWAEPVFRLVSNLVDASMKYLTDNFASVLGSESFQRLDTEPTWNIGRLEDHLLAAAERLPPEQACKAYSRLDKMFICRQVDAKPFNSWGPLFVDLMNKIKAQVEKCLVRDAARAARTNSWLKMDLELRRRIQELACLVILPNEAPGNVGSSSKRPSRHSNFLKEPKERHQETTRIMSSSRTPPNRNFDFRKMKMAISEHNDRTLKQQTPLLQTRKVMNKPKTDPLQRKLLNDKLVNDLTSSFSRPKSWPNKIEVKSRYLEPRTTRLATKETNAQQITNSEKGSLSQQRKKIIISSSDSSRTSSPAMRRAACERKIQPKTLTKVPVRKDGKALSSDSLTGAGGSNSRSAQPKKEPASKSCGITRPESPSLKAKNVDSGFHPASGAQHQNLLKKVTNKMDTSMSADSLMAADATAITTPRSMSTNKSSPILSKATTIGGQIRNYDKAKKSPPVQQRQNNVNMNNNNSSLRRPGRSLENSTAASRSRAAAVANSYHHGTLNLRKSLLDAAKAPEIPSKTLSSPAMARTSLRQSTIATRLSSSSSFTAGAACGGGRPTVNEKRDGSGASPGSKRSPKSNVNSRLNKSMTLAASRQTNRTNKLKDDKAAVSNKLKSQTTCPKDPNGPKFLNQSSRSGTFLKDEPTILNKSDIETAAIDA